MFLIIPIQAQEIKSDNHISKSVSDEIRGEDEFIYEIGNDNVDALLESAEEWTVVSSGECGKIEGSVFYEILQKNNTVRLHIYGAGAMKDYNSTWYLPWDITQSNGSSLVTRITEAVVDEGVTTLGRSTFSGCKQLKEIYLPQSLTSIGGYAFSRCEDLEDIEIPQNVKTIGDNAFQYCTGLKDIQIPDGVETLGNEAFAYCDNLEKINLPNSIINVGEKALNGYKLKTAGPVGGGYNIEFAWSDSIPENAFNADTYLYSIVIPEGISLIDKKAFYYCIELQEVSFPDSLITIESSTFYGCKKLEEIELKDNVEFIGGLAFYNCESLSSISLSSQLSEINNYTFEGCSKLSSIVLPDNINRIGDHAFSNCSKLSTIMLPDGLRKIDNNAFYRCSLLKEVVFCNGIEEIGSEVFYECTALSLATLPDSVKAMGEMSFYGCENLKTIHIPSSLNGIADKAFYGCKSVTTIVFPDSISSIGYSAFCECRSLKKVDIPSNVKTIGSGAFEYCTSLESFIVEEGVTEIGSFCLYGCSKLNKVVIPKNCTPKGDLGIYSYSLRTAGPIGGGYDYEFGFNTVFPSAAACENINTYTFPEGITEVFIPKVDSKYSSNNPYYTKIDLPSTLQKITCQRNVNEINYNGSSVLWQKVSGSSSITVKTIHYNSSAVGNVKLDHSDCEMYISDSLQLKATVLPVNAYDKTVVWSSTDSTIAKVTNEGLVTAVSPGSATITVTTNNGSFSDACTIVVRKKPGSVDGITLDKSSIRLKEGKSIQLVATISPEDAIEKNVIWKSGNNSIATISDDGFVYGKKKGKTQITATSVDGGYVATCDIEVIYEYESEEEVPDDWLHNYRYAYTDDTLVIWSYSGTDPNPVVYPTGYDLNKTWKIELSTNVFYQTKVETVTIKDGVKILEDVVNSANDGSPIYGNNFTFADCPNLKKVILPEGVKSIGEFQFADCPALEEVVIPDTVTIIRQGAFMNCSALETMVLPNSLTVIENSAFAECVNLKTISLPASLESIGDLAFMKCGKLNNLRFPDNLDKIGEKAFSSCNNLNDITYDGRFLSSIGQDAFYYSKSTVLNTVIHSSTRNLLSTVDWRSQHRNAIFVTPEEDDCLVISNNMLSMKINSNEVISVIRKPASLEYDDLIWSIDDPDIASIQSNEQNCYITGRESGSTRVVVSTQDGKSVYCTVTVYSSAFEDEAMIEPGRDDEHFLCVRNGVQKAEKDNFEDPQTMWAITNGTSQWYSTDDANGYAIRLEEMYIGTEAATIIKNENRYNTEPSSSQQYYLLKIYLKNTGTHDFKGTDIIKASSSYYTSAGAGIAGTTVTFSKERSGKGLHDVALQPGASTYCWIGILADKESGYPLIKLSNGYDKTTKTANYVWLNTDPFYGVYDVTFNANGSTINVNTKQVKLANQYGALPLPEPLEEYVFKGWSTDREGKAIISAETIVIEKTAHSLYAQWKPEGYEIIFDANGGENEIESKVIKIGEQFGNLPITERDGYVFEGWFDDPIEGRKIDSTDVALEEGSLTVYAHWKGVDVQVSFDANGGKCGESAKLVLFGDLYGELPVATKDGAKFDGWFTVVDGGERIDQNTVVDNKKPHTLFAHWSEATVERLDVFPESLNMNVNESRMISVSIYPDDLTDTTLTWSSNNEGIAMVSGKGTEATVRAVSTGNAVITVKSDNGISASVPVYVLDSTIKSQYLLKFINSGTLYKTIFVNQGDVVEEIATPSGNGTFVGWYVNGSRWDNSQPVYSDMILKARFVDSSTGKNKDDSIVKTSALDSQPNFKGSEQNLTLIKGQKFILGYGYWESSSKSYLTINSNNVATAKKATYTPIKLVHRLSGDTATYNVSIVQPSIEKSFTIQVGDTETVWINNYGNLNITWYSSSPDVASVDTNGKVYGISKGTSTISAYINGKEFNCKVKVLDVDNSKPNFRSSYPISLAPMQSTTVKSSGFKPANASWSSDRTPVHYSRLGKGVVFEDDVVRITKAGKITAIGAGTSKLKAAGGGTTLEFTITVSEPVTQIVHLNKGSSKTIKIYGTKGSLPWKQSNSILEYTGNKIKGVVAGTTTLTAKYENFEYRVVVFVEDPYITNRNVHGGDSKYNVTLKSGQTIVLTHRQVYQNVLYKSNKNDIASIDEAGVLTARNTGKATLTGKINGKKITIIVTVQ